MKPRDPSEALLSISPLDGRYATQVQVLSEYFSEFALIRARIRVEIAWFLTLAGKGLIPSLDNLRDAETDALHRVWQDFDIRDALRVKDLEATTNHDVKACEYFLRECLAEREALAAFKPASQFLHFAATSEDVNSTAYGLLLHSCVKERLAPCLQALLDDIDTFATAHASLPMLSRTHGQPASPTTLGKEFKVFTHRLGTALDEIRAVAVRGKFNGAVGNFNAHVLAFPNVDWENLSFDFVRGLGLEPQILTTQIEPHDDLARLCHALMRWNSVLLDMSRDIWGYIALGYIKQRCRSSETGSSTMPHKINPIDFENCEGNLGVSNALLGHLADKLPVSRWQRDLSDSTGMRNLGVAIGHAFLAVTSARRGLTKIAANQEVIASELDQAWEVLGEAAQTLMRREGIDDAYERLKHLTRGERLTQAAWQRLVRSLDLPEATAEQLEQLTPATYLGLAAEFGFRRMPERLPGSE